MFKETGLVDLWRVKNPISRNYMHYSPSYKVYSRIDYFFILNENIHRIEKCEIRFTLWRLNTNLLNNTIIKNNLKYVIKRYLDENDNEEVGPIILWDALKAVIRGKIIAISSNKKKMRLQKQNKLEEDLRKLQH